MVIKKIFSIVFLICFFQILQAANVTITTSKDTVCTGADVKFKGTAIGTITKYQWVIDSAIGVTLSPNDSAQNVTVNFSKPGTYTVTLYVTRNPGGLDSSKKIITVIQSATAMYTTSGITLGVPQTISFTNTSTNAPNGYVWNFSDNLTSIQTNPTHTFATANVYTVTLIAYGSHGCNDTVSSPLIISDTSGLTMPNVFTPNGDGINDVFAPNAHGLKTLDCTIYDRWGAKIIDMDINLQYWDGYTTSGEDCAAGTYFYVVKATDLNGKSYNLKGFLQLIR
ncbi:MAG TPA: gliding motility-associated C-terminal domain-containing protein [Bacteroidia bacterium]|nr:gliding motility-associated C-terminal domain-containing protein [Bacteroidia bacterium]